ncbi:MAG: nucleoside deaminase [Prevotellaceae bacterium]|jgi:tRNA(adenine34) deaminase|nr:nucleoside deaminase [Prevotellaceae bacterium]
MIDLTTELYTDEYFMKEALIEAEKAFDAGEIPVGAVIVWKNRIIGRGHNLTETLTDPTAHAEIQAITAATHTIGGKYLTECILYVTLEPCVMCAGACFWAQLGTVVYGTDDKKRGYSLVNHNVLHPKTHIIKGVLKKQSANLLKTFFQKIR